MAACEMRETAAFGLWLSFEKSSNGDFELNNLILRVICVFQNLANGDEGQDLVEYALLTSLIALAAIGGVSKVATAVTSIFTKISTSIA